MLRLTVAQQQLVEDHLWIVEMPVQEMALMTSDERRAAAYYGLCRAATKPSKNFVAYAQQAARTQIKMDHRALHRIGSSGRIVRSSMFRSGWTESIDQCVYHEYVDICDELEMAIKKLSTLSGIEYRVIIGMIEGLNIHQIARSIGKRRTAIREIQRTARAKLA